MQDLISYLHGDGLLTRAESAAIRRASRDLAEGSVRILRSLNVAAPQDIQRCFKVYFNIPLVTDALVDNLTSDYAALVPVDIALHFGVFGFGLEGNRLHVAMEDPTDRRVLEALKFFLGKDILPAAANVYQLCTALERLYGVAEADSGLQTVLDRARGAGAWSQHERALFEKMIEERRLREEEARQALKRKKARAVQPAAAAARVGAPAVAATVAAMGAATGAAGAALDADLDDLTPELSAGAGTEAADELLEGFADGFAGAAESDEGAVPSALDALQSQAGALDLAALEPPQREPAPATALNGAEPEAESLEALMAETAELDDLASFDEDGFDEGLPDLSLGEDPDAAALADVEEDKGAPADQEASPAAEVSRLTLASLTQKALLKSALVNDGAQVMALVNEIFGGVGVRFVAADGQPVSVDYRGQPVSADDFKAGPWPTLVPLIRMLEKKCQSKAG